MLQVTQPRSVRLAAAARTLALSDITAKAASLPDFAGHEQIWLGRDEVRGLTAIVAIHSTTLGPALGGTRVWPHASFEAALTDALRLSHGMTMKAAIAGVPFGGGKAVIVADPKTQKTPALLDAYAEMLTALAGQYITAEDVGLTLADADYLGARAPNVTGTSSGGSGNPSPVTAQGVFLGLKAALEHRNGSDRLDGVTVAVQGLGSVGQALCEKLAAEGARLVVGDLDAARVADAQASLGAAVVAPDAVIAAEADIFAPCALGGVLSQETLPRLRARIVAGAANNQLATPDIAQALATRGVLYAPDYVINSGGLINVAAECAPGGYDRDRAMEAVRGIPRTLSVIFERAAREGRTTEAVAETMALERLGQGR